MAKIIKRLGSLDTGPSTTNYNIGDWLNRTGTLSPSGQSGLLLLPLTGINKPALGAPHAVRLGRSTLFLVVLVVSWSCFGASVLLLVHLIDRALPLYLHWTGRPHGGMHCQMHCAYGFTFIYFAADFFLGNAFLSQRVVFHYLIVFVFCTLLWTGALCSSTLPLSVCVHRWAITFLPCLQLLTLTLSLLKHILLPCLLLNAPPGTNWWWAHFDHSGHPPAARWAEWEKCKNYQTQASNLAISFSFFALQFSASFSKKWLLAQALGLSSLFLWSDKYYFFSAQSHFASAALWQWWALCVED